MLCIFFKVRTEYPLRKYLNKLDNKYDNPNNSKKTRHNALRKLMIIYKAIDYASTCPLYEFHRIRTENVPWNQNLYFDDPYNGKQIDFGNVGLIKNVGFKNIKQLPIFELRLNGVKRFNIGFRCIFIVTDYNHTYYECYTLPFSKKKYDNDHDKRVGNQKTDSAISITYQVYNSYRNNPDEFEPVFSSRNIIKEGR